MVRQFSPKLEAEISERLYINHEDGGDMTRADYVKELIQDSDDRDAVAFDFRKELREYAIEVGIYVVVSDAEYHDTVVHGNKSKMYYRHKGLRYRFESWRVLTND
jgi:hypothetical protein